MAYSLRMPDRMMGFLGDTVLVNGQVGRTAVVPAGIVRLRLLNGSNARIYKFSLASGQHLHLIATEAGFMPSSTALKEITLAPGERVEVLVDFTDVNNDSLVSATVSNSPMMGGGQRGGMFEVQKFSVDSRISPKIISLLGDTGEILPDLDPINAIQRRISLDMGMGGGMMMGCRGGAFSINGMPFEMGRINLQAKQGQTELWRVTAPTMMHPFHIHGTRFQVFTENGRRPSLQNRGWKDTILVDGTAELLMRFDYTASKEAPYMYHCHILEHEDGGMMGQFTVS